MKIVICILLVLYCSANAQAWSNFVENPYTPYPPGCATVPDLQILLYGDNTVKFFEQVIPLDVAFGSRKENVNVAAYRIGCADSNRSVIWLAFSIPSDVPEQTYYRTPRVRAVIGDYWFLGVSLVREPNGWDVGNQPWDYAQIFGGAADFEDGHEKTWIFVLDPMTSFDGYFSAGMAITPTQYNGSFKLELNWPEHAGWDIQVPSTASVLTANPRIPLSGRLSGAWVVNGAADQGFVLSISEMVPDTIPEFWDLVDDPPLLMFLSWYTFDANGNMLWLTGDAEFKMGASAVTVPVVRVTNGEFMGDKAADREVVGSATITGINCNDLAFEYTLNEIGLGSGTSHLQRIFSLETAGYTCRDLEARMATK